MYVSQPYHRHVPIVWKSGSLNLLEPSDTLQAYTGIALSLYIYIYIYICVCVCVCVCILGVAIK
jgi:hypothetical protein